MARSLHSILGYVKYPSESWHFAYCMDPCLSYLTLHDLEPLRYLTDTGGEARTSRDKPQEENLLFIGE